MRIGSRYRGPLARQSRNHKLVEKSPIESLGYIAKTLSRMGCRPGPWKISSIVVLEGEHRRTMYATRRT
jgi:hypothetical protein